MASTRGLGVAAIGPTLVPLTVLAIAAAFPPVRLPALAILVCGLVVTYGNACL